MQSIGIFFAVHALDIRITFLPFFYGSGIDGFRGSHYKPEFDLHQPDDFRPETYLEFEKQKEDGQIKEDEFSPDHLAYMKRFSKNNIKWLKTTIATYRNGGPEISYEAVDTSLIDPRPRKYD